MSYLPPILSSIARTFGLGGDSSTSSSSSSASPVKSSDSNSASKGENMNPRAYKASAMDVVVTKMMLQQGLKLPAEVILSILDFAEYWPHTSATLKTPFITLSGGDRENQFVVSSISRVDRRNSSLTCAHKFSAANQAPGIDQEDPKG